MRLQFILSEIGIGLRRNWAMTVSVVLVTFVSLVFIGLAMLAQQQVSTMKDYWYDRVQVSIFLCTADSLAPSCAEGEVSAAQRDGILADLEGDDLAPYIESVQYESKEEAFERFQEQFEGTAVVDNVTVDVMPESYRVRLVDPEEYEVISQRFDGLAGVEEVVDQGALLDRFFQFLNGLTLGSLVLAGVMLVAAVLLVGTTIRLSAASRRRETGIMRLVGASNTLLQLPFLLEGVIAVSIGAALATASLWLGVRLGVPWLESNLPLFDYIGTGAVVSVAPWLFGIGLVVAGVSSLVTLSRYLKV
ncbi:MAG TPA: permease-like cell division protein FtsX [Mycobacteriales bacterium]|jgi:cell division transport system permease protein|nr:permease-like cell division protein FtsX [Mycobacteriales bacterium]